MKTSEESKNIIKALAKAQQEFRTVGKDRTNPFAESKYATLDAILKEILPKLNAVGLFLTQEPLTDHDEKNVRIGVRTKIYHDSGEWVEYEPLFMIMEKGAKMNMAQSAGSIITYAKRYTVSAIFGISTDDDNDGVQPEYKNMPNNQQKNNNQQYRKKPEQQSSNKPKELSNLEQEIISTLNRIEDLGADRKEVQRAYMTDEKQKDFKDSNRFLMYIQRKLAELEMPDQEQGTLLEDRTTKVVEWGKRK